MRRLMVLVAVVAGAAMLYLVAPRLHTSIVGAGGAGQDAPDEAASPTTAPGGATPAAAGASLVVQVRWRGGGGAAPADDSSFGTATPAPSGTPVPGVTVEVRDVNDPDTVAAQQTTDDQGQAAFVLPPGDYWVDVPRGERADGFDLAHSIVAEMPNGTLVLSWTEVTVPADGGATATLTIITPLP